MKRKTRPKSRLANSVSLRGLRGQSPYSHYNPVLETYKSQISDHDKQVKNILNDSLTQAKQAITSLVIVYWMVFITSLGLIVFGLSMVWYFPQSDVRQNIGLGVAGSGVVLVFFVLQRDILRSVRKSVEDLAKTNIVLQGYARQVNQLDIHFREAYLSSTVHGQETKMISTIEQLRQSMQHAMMSFDDYTGEG